MKFRDACALPAGRPPLLLASLGGIGFLRPAPGSWGSLAALAAAWVAAGFGGRGALLAGAVVLFFLGWWSAAQIARAGPVSDPGFVVIDEAAGQWLTLLPAGRSLAGYALAFLLFRLFDIWKPWPVSWADRSLKGGLGIMLDDTLAAGYALFVLLLLRAIGGMPGVRS
ncbi:MAG TPA: phosphatidylglycerophosphatase A [Stellaceae bacterium]|nr:phosphatidylglycerophosphatase A [Stellaceae bacterium]